MSPKDPEPIFLTNLYFPPTMNSDLEADGAEAIIANFQVDPEVFN